LSLAPRFTLFPVKNTEPLSFCPAAGEIDVPVMFEETKLITIELAD
jgi:hypothetical protein